MASGCAARRRWLTPAWTGAALLCATGPALAAGKGGLYPGDLGQAIATLLTFAVLLYILGRYAWKPIVQQLRRREQEVAETVNRAAKQQDEAEKLLARYQEMTAKADSESKELLAASRREAVAAREQMLADARAESRRIVKTAQDEIRQARDEAVRDLREKAAELVADVAVKVLGGELDEEDHRRLLERSLHEISSRVSEDRK